jgi:hypothetical protein
MGITMLIFGYMPAFFNNSLEVNDKLVNLANVISQIDDKKSINPKVLLQGKNAWRGL